MADDTEPVRSALLTALLRLSRNPDPPALTAFCQELTVVLGVSGVRLTIFPSGPAGAAGDYRWPVADSAHRPARYQQPVPVLQAGEPIGTLVLQASAPEAVLAAQAELTSGAAVLLGPVLQLARIEAEREAAVVRARYLAERIAVERRVALGERDRERRELERDLHDGAQHHLLALQMSVALLDLSLEAGNREGGRDSLSRLRTGAGQAERSLLEMAAGSCPPILLEQGVPAALAAELGDDPARGGVGVRTQGPPRRLSPVAETAVFFTCLEAVSNARKHAPGAPLTVTLRHQPDGLAFQVADEGPGLTRTSQAGPDPFGLTNMRARIEAVGGRLEVRAGPAAGTTVEGFIPG